MVLMTIKLILKNNSVFILSFNLGKKTGKKEASNRFGRNPIRKKEVYVAHTSFREVI